MKQAVAPKKPLHSLWDWISREIDPDVIVLTEARVPPAGLPDGWAGVWTPGGIGPRRTWGTIVAGRGVDLQAVCIDAESLQRTGLSTPHAGTVQTVDVIVNKNLWATVIGAYGFMPQSKNGWDALEGIINTVICTMDLGRDRLILAGDFNLWPDDLVPTLEESIGLVDIMGCVTDLPKLEKAVGGSRIWTHKNGNSPNAARQELDYIFTTEVLADEVLSVGGGIGDFPNAWDMSDHAPVVVEFE
jgi:hypothetical protein